MYNKKHFINKFYIKTRALSTVFHLGILYYSKLNGYMYNVYVELYEYNKYKQN